MWLFGMNAGQNVHIRTRETKGWKTASAHAPTRLHPCAVCDKWLQTGPSRLLPCWKAAGYSSQNDPLYVANYGSLVRVLRSTWIATKIWNITERDAPAERVVTIWHRACLKRGLSGAKVEIPNSSISVLSWKVGSMARHSKEIFELSLRNPHKSSFCRRPAPHRMSSGR